MWGRAGAPLRTAPSFITAPACSPRLVLALRGLALIQVLPESLLDLLGAFLIFIVAASSPARLPAPALADVSVLVISCRF